MAEIKYSETQINDIIKNVNQNILNIIDYKVINIDNNSPYVDSILKLESKVFGEGFINKDELLNQISLSKFNKSHNTIGIIKDGILIGFGICYNGGNWNKNDVEIDNQFNDLSKIGYIKTIIVDSDFQGKTEGAVIISTLLKNAELAGNKAVLLHAWDGSPNNSSIRFFEKNGAIKIKTYKNKWLEDSLENGWKCSKCGNPCTCGSVEMIIKLKAQEKKGLLFNTEII